jgi:beta-lactamase regulating signal transducer with metallopeptidase domain/protocatechuate 3,4-dioxygenase beta subunit
MTQLIDGWLSPGLWLLGGWSLRWGIFILLVAFWFAVRMPRHAATRDAIWRIVLVMGLLVLPSGAGLVALIKPSTPAGQTEIPSAPLTKTETEKTLADPAPAPTLRDGNRGTASSIAATDPAAPSPVDPGEPWDVARVGVLLLSGAWILGVILHALRLLAGWSWLVRLGQTARAPCEAAQRQFEACRQECSVRETVLLGIHTEVLSPIFVGGPKRRILVPDDWDTLPAETRRGILLHELAHVARRDDQMKLFEEVVRVFFFFHPLVHYLLTRLDRDREEICDATAVRQGVNPRELAQILLGYGRQAGQGGPLTYADATLPFLRRHTLKKRIASLLDHQVILRWNQPPSRLGTSGAVCLTIVLMFVSRGVALRGAEPPALARAANTSFLEGRLVDVRGTPVKNAKVLATYSTEFGALVTAPGAAADALGRFRAAPLHESLAFPLGGIAMLSIITEEGQYYESNVLIEEGRSLIHVPTLLGAHVEKIEDVAVGELAGSVIDDEGAPLAGVTVDVGYARPGHETTTDARGRFRLKGFNRDEKVEVILSKAGYSPETFMQQPTGVAGWVVALGKRTYVEGTVRAPDRSPAANALVRANQGPKLGSGFRRAELWTETRTDERGHYRLYVQPDAYELAVEAPGIGVARLEKRPIGYGKVLILDVDLEPGITFRARLVDAATSKPVPGVRIHHWLNRKIDSRSDATGVVSIADMLPGRLEFSVAAQGYGRWWSAQAVSEWNRQSVSQPELNWQRNFDSLDFDVTPEMAPVTIVLEKAVRVRGRVIDPDGSPVAGATAAPSLTGSGNSLTGDSRFSVTTGSLGTFEMWLPASNDAEYNLMAHDGTYQQWRKWANGTLPPMRTRPGQEIEGVEIRLTRPATVRGIVLDEKGKPVAYREVRAHAADKRENRYYDPTVKTKDDGTFELPWIRPGEQFIQAAPFFLVAEQAPKDTTRTLILEPGQTVQGIQLIARETR